MKINRGFDAKRTTHKLSINDRFLTWSWKSKLCDHKLKSHLLLNFLISLHHSLFDLCCNRIWNNEEILLEEKKSFVHQILLRRLSCESRLLCCQFLASLVSRWVWESESRNRVVCATEKKCKWRNGSSDSHASCTEKLCSHRQQWRISMNRVLVQHENRHAAITDNSSISNFVGDLVVVVGYYATTSPFKNISFPSPSTCVNIEVRLRTQKRFCFTTTINSRLLRLMAAHYFYCYMHLTSLLCSYCCATHASLACDSHRGPC